MRKSLIAFITLLSCGIADTPEIKTPKEIRLLVATRKGALIESRGHYRIYDTLKQEPLAFAGRGKRLWVEARGSGLRLGDNLLNINQVVFIPQDKKSTLLIDGIQYGGAVAIYGSDEKIFCVNEVNLEEYVASVLSDKLDHKAEREALHALAIVERTRGAYLAHTGEGKNWHAVAADVGYTGYGSTKKKIGIEEAALATRSFILQSGQSHAPLFGFDAPWCMHSAGSLAPLGAVAKKVGFDSSIYTTSAFAKKDASAAKWSYELSREALAKALHVDAVTEVEAICEPKSSKVSALKVRDDENGIHEIDFLTLQRLYGHEFVQSNTFQVVGMTKKGILLEGTGRGLGAGLCLYSAEQMSLLGQDALEILSTFFPQTKVEKIETLAEVHAQKKSGETA